MGMGGDAVHQHRYDWQLRPHQAKLKAHQVLTVIDVQLTANHLMVPEEELNPGMNTSTGSQRKVYG